MLQSRLPLHPQREAPSVREPEGTTVSESQPLRVRLRPPRWERIALDALGIGFACAALGDLMLRHLLPVAPVGVLPRLPSPPDGED